MDEALAVAAAAWSATDVGPLLTDLTAAVAATKLAIHRLYFTPVVGMMTFTRLVNELNYRRYAEGQLLLRVIVLLNEDEGQLIQALQRAYGPGEP